MKSRKEEKGKKIVFWPGIWNWFESVERFIRIYRNRIRKKKKRGGVERRKWKTYKRLQRDDMFSAHKFTMNGRGSRKGFTTTYGNYKSIHYESKEIRKILKEKNMFKLGKILLKKIRTW